MESKYVRNKNGAIVSWSHPSGPSEKHRSLGQIDGLTAKKQMLEAKLVAVKQQNVPGRKKVVKHLRDQIKHIARKLGYGGDSDSMRLKR